VEQRVDLSAWFGEDQGGTSDAIIVLPEQKLIVIEDLKYGVGEKVYAEENPQGLSYALGALDIVRLLTEFGGNWTVRIVIHQPRLNHVDEWDCTVNHLITFGCGAKRAIAEAGRAMLLPPNSPQLLPFLHPSKKACRWCRALATCPAAAAKVAEEVRAEFDTIVIDTPVVPQDNAALSRAMIAAPFISQWCKAVFAETDRRVRDGQEIIGEDGKPYKLVEGDLGDRKWNDELAAEAALLGQLPEDKAYAPRKILTAAAASKLLDKKATKQLWKDVFQPLISRAPGQPKLALGSDPRPPYAGAATSDDFAEIPPE
jgi:hypothetical protein